MQWQTTTRERLVRKGANDKFRPKRGRFVPSQRFNVYKTFDVSKIIELKAALSLLEKKYEKCR